MLSNKISFANRAYALHVFKKNVDSELRVGISAGVRLGNAVVRNKVKRQVKMMVETIFDKKQAIDVVIIVRNGYMSLTYEQNQNELSRLYEKMTNKLRMV